MQRNPRLLFLAALSLVPLAISSRYAKLDSRTQPIMASAIIRPLTTVIQQARGTHSATVFFMHGLGDSGQGWAPVARELSQVPSLKHVKWVLPNAFANPVSLNFGMEMPSWYDISSLSSPDEIVSEPGILESIDNLTNLIKKEIDAGIPSERIVVAGFSQGAVMALALALTSQLKFAGIIVLSGYLPLKSKMLTLATEANKRTPILQGHGDADAVVQYRFGHLSYKWLQENNYDVRFKTYTGMGHSSSKKELQDMVTFLEEVLPEQAA